MGTERQNTLSDLDKSTVSLALMIFADYVDRAAETQDKIADLGVDDDPAKQQRRRDSAIADRGYADDIRRLRTQVDAARTVRLSTRVHAGPA